MTNSSFFMDKFNDDNIDNNIFEFSNSEKLELIRHGLNKDEELVVSSKKSCADMLNQGKKIIFYKGMKVLSEEITNSEPDIKFKFNLLEPYILKRNREYLKIAPFNIDRKCSSPQPKNQFFEFNLDLCMLVSKKLENPVTLFDIILHSDGITNTFSPVFTQPSVITLDNYSQDLKGLYFKALKEQYDLEVRYNTKDDLNWIETRGQGLTTKTGLEFLLSIQSDKQGTEQIGSIQINTSNKELIKKLREQSNSKDLVQYDDRLNILEISGGAYQSRNIDRIFSSINR